MSQLIEGKVTIESLMRNPPAVVPLVVHQNHPFLEAVRRLEENMNHLTMMRRTEREEIRAILGGARTEMEELRAALGSHGHKKKGSFSNIFVLGCLSIACFYAIEYVSCSVEKRDQWREHDGSLALSTLVGGATALLAYGLYKYTKKEVIDSTSVLEESPRIIVPDR